MSFEVLKAGLLSTFQDNGRMNHQSLGIPVAGALDSNAHRIANLLVGNTSDLATLEITLIGPTLKFGTPCCIALSGADLSPAVNGFSVPMNRPLVMRRGDILTFGQRKSGARAYMAVHGGYRLDKMFSSTSTYLRSAIGGFKGRALKINDVITLNTSITDSDLELLALNLWNIKVYLHASLNRFNHSKVRIIKSAQWNDFTPESQANILTETFKVTPVSDRMGYRLQGPELRLSAPRQMISESVVFGTIQVPVGGQAIILMADRQTTGGYPKIAYVVSVDLPLLAQMMPGDTFSFSLIDIAKAQQLDLKHELDLQDLARQIHPVKTCLEQAAAHFSEAPITSLAETSHA
jgi:biotin-dependent carboxylase-like uncharacterized protein